MTSQGRTKVAAKFRHQFFECIQEDIWHASLEPERSPELPDPSSTHIQCGGKTKYFHDGHHQDPRLQVCSLWWRRPAHIVLDVAEWKPLLQGRSGSSALPH